MASEEKDNNSLVPVNKKSSGLARVMSIPATISSNIDVAVHSANMKGRIKIAIADQIVKHGLLRKKPRR